MDWLSFKATAWHELPCFPGVYRFYDKEGTLLYVGKAKQLVKRVGSYFQQNNTLNGRTRRMVKQVDYIMCTEVPSEHDALLLENLTNPYAYWLLLCLENIFGGNLFGRYDTIGFFWGGEAI